jgi:uncharacterized membrane protein YphA (DoxX/SURF4 family)
MNHVESPLGNTFDLRPLGWARAAIGVLLLLRTTPILCRVHPQLFDTWPLLGWPEHALTAKSGILALTPGIIEVLCVTRTIAAVLFLFGIWTAFSGLAAGVCGYLVLMQDPFGFIFTLHLLYQAAMLLALTDAGATFSVRPSRVRAPRSSYWLMRAFVASIYFWAGLYKLRPDWLDGRTLALFHESGVLRGPLIDLVFSNASARAALASSVALLELSLPAALLWPTTRRYALIVAFAFHAGLEFTAHPDLLGWGMAALLLTFLPSASSALTSTPSRDFRPGYAR